MVKVTGAGANLFFQYSLICLTLQFMSKSCLTGTFLTTITRKPHLYPCSRGLIMNEISLSLHFN